MRIVKKYQGGNQLTYLPYMYGADPIYYATLPQNKVLPEDTKQDLAKANFKLRMASILPFLGMSKPGMQLLKLTQPSTYIQKIAGLISPGAELKAAAYVSPMADIITNTGYALSSMIPAMYGVSALFDPEYKNKADAIANTLLGSLGFMGISVAPEYRGVYSASKALKRKFGFDVNRPAFVSSSPSKEVGIHQQVLDKNGNPLRYEDILPSEIVNFLSKYKEPSNPYIYKGIYFDFKNPIYRSRTGGLAQVGTLEYPGFGTKYPMNKNIALHEVGGHGTENNKILEPYYKFIDKWEKILDKYNHLFYTQASTYPNEIRATSIQSILNGYPKTNPEEFINGLYDLNGYGKGWYQFFNNPQVKAEPQYNEMLDEFITLMNSEIQ